MATGYFTVNCPHEMPDGDVCGGEIEVEASIVPGQIYGADADGNRGVWEPAYVEEVYPKSPCEHCGCTYTDEEVQKIGKMVDEKFAKDPE